MATYEFTILKALGGSMLEVRDGYAKAELPLSEKVMQPTRVYHAGAIVTLADEVASAALVGGATDPESMKGKRFPYSIQLSVNLLTNDPVGPITAEASVLRKGRVAVVDTVVTTSTGKTAAVMRSTHLMVDPGSEGPHHKTTP
ncbi:MAG: PaaI family thioesterase [Cyanobacteria bacterium HKST-UBA02]|nr:PaaI family thioesterase [Cyanobacteria bacterium HKST-UBA02]